MHVSDEKLAQVWDQGFAVVEGFLDKGTLAAAQEALWEVFPRPEAYFAEPQKWPAYAKSQFAGVRVFPYPNWALNRLAVLPDLVDAAERFLAATDIEIYKIELWAKYAGAVDYDQFHHRDFGNHTLVAPRADGVRPQMTTFILLSDVTESDGPTKVVPLSATRTMPMMPRHMPFGAFAEEEVAITGPAGTLFIYKTDVFHRGSNFAQAGRSRFVYLADFQRKGWPWMGKVAWPDHAERRGWNEAMVNMTPRQRDLFGWPPIGSDYWNAQTLADVAARYPGIDLSPYAAPS